jgi:acetyl-CoA acetyltransferase
MNLARQMAMIAIESEQRAARNSDAGAIAVAVVIVALITWFIVMR